MSNVLIIGGQDMKVSDPHRFWRIADALQNKGYSIRLRECLETGKASPLTISDVLWADSWIDYSHGTASRKKLVKDLGYFPNGKQIDLWIPVAAVPEILYGQVYGDLWHAEDYVRLAVCFQVNTIPASCGIDNALSRSFSSPLALPGPISRFNVHCDTLLMGEPLPHVAIKDNELVCTEIERLFPQIGGGGA